MSRFGCHRHKINVPVVEFVEDKMSICPVSAFEEARAVFGKCRLLSASVLGEMECLCS